MPCMSYEDEPENFKPELDRVTALLCLACNIIKDQIGFDNIPEDYYGQDSLEDPAHLEHWFNKHRADDIANTLGMLEQLRLEDLSKQDFDRLTKILGEIV